MVAWYGCRRENTKWENILNIFRAFQKNGSNYISKNSSYYTRCGRRTFLPVLRHLITLNLPDYCPIISRIKFWWFSFFLKPKTDLRKPRYQFFPKTNFCPQKPGRRNSNIWLFAFGSFRDCVFGIFPYLCVCICLCICLCVCISVFFCICHSYCF